MSHLLLYNKKNKVFYISLYEDVNIRAQVC